MKMLFRSQYPLYKSTFRPREYFYPIIATFPSVYVVIDKKWRIHCIPKSLEDDVYVVVGKSKGA